MPKCWAAGKRSAQAFCSAAKSDGQAIILAVYACSKQRAVLRSKVTQPRVTAPTPPVRSPSVQQAGVAVRAVLARGGRDNGFHIDTLSPTSRD